MQPIDSKTETSKSLNWLHFPKTHFIVTSALTVSLLGLLSVWPSKDANAIKHKELSAEKALSDQAISFTEQETNDPQWEIDSAQTTATASQIVIETELSQPEDSNLTAIASEVLSSSVDQNSPSEPTQNWQKQVVKSGDNLSNIFKRVKLSDRDVYQFVNSSDSAKGLTKLKPGEEIEFLIEEGELVAVRYKPNRLDTLMFNKSDASFDFTQQTAVPDVKLAFNEAQINESLFLAGSRVGMDDSVIMEMANIFGWDIDFVLDIRKGDKFKVLYEEKFLDGEKFANGAILAAEFTNQNKTYRAVRYTDESGDSQYYTPDGQSMRKEFLRTPVDFARISSHFNLQRKHPVLNTIRAHKGTDYAAPKGTPIKAVGDGKVVFAGKKGGYGNAIIIQHGQTYKTLYAHMNNFRRGVKNGTHVKQGQVIGYVGSTGLATGPHLHYEFYVNGAVRNPVTVKLPKAKSIPDAQMLRFAQQTQPHLAKLGVIANTQLALQDVNDPKQ
ncbi:peptidoglycan DD-metalloendopeptidase family protein [Sessilibacter sp. MAH1]